MEKGVKALNKGNLYVIIVSIRRKSVIKLAQKLISKGFNPSRIIVVTNISDTTPLLALGILPGNIGRKKRAGFAGALNIGAGIAIRDETYPSIIAFSTEIRSKDLLPLFSRAIERESDIGKKKMIAISSKGENGMLVYKAETIMSCFLMNDIKNGGITIDELIEILKKTGVTVELDLESTAI